jgi:hypothetical protein
MDTPIRAHAHKVDVRQTGSASTLGALRDDYVCELVNVVAGNAKALLAPGHRLGPPRFEPPPRRLVTDLANAVFRRYQTSNGQVIVVAGDDASSRSTALRCETCGRSWVIDLAFVRSHVAHPGAPWQCVDCADPQRPRVPAKAPT